MLRFSPGICALLLAFGSYGCNSGLAALFGTDDSSNAPSSITAFAVLNTETSPATIRFRVIDADGDAANVSLFYEVPGMGPALMTELGGAQNPSAYTGSASGTEYTLLWDFAAEANLPGNASYVPGVMTSAQIEGATSTVLGANATVLGLGNDPPVIASVDVPAVERSGIVPIGVTVEDSSADLVSIRIEYRRVGDRDWALAQPAGQTNTPLFAFQGLSAPEDGTFVNFFWDTAVNLAAAESEVQLRITPIDPTIPGDAFVTEAFRIDNNDETQVILDNGLITLNPDTSGGLAIPFTLLDDESDLARVIFQWRAAGGTFPELPGDPAEAFAILDDPALRAQYQVCTVNELPVEGRVELVDATHLRMRELGTSRMPLRTSALVGRELRILRPQNRIEELTQGFGTNPVEAAVAVAAAGDSTEAWILCGDGGWSLRRIVLATGEVLATAASGPGSPTALAVGGDEAFVATLHDGTWTVSRIDLERGLETASVSGDTSSGGVHGLTVVGRERVAFTLEDSILLGNLNAKPPVAIVAVTGLANPRGIVVDSRRRNHVFVAEHDADRVLHVDCATGAFEAVLFDDPSPVPVVGLDFPNPMDVALDRGGSRLLVTCTTVSGRELRSLNLNSTYDADESGYADRVVRMVASFPAGGPLGLATGSAHLRLVLDGDAHELHAMGGIEQRATVVDASPSSNVIALAAPLAPVPSAPRIWSVDRKPEEYATSPGGIRHVFPWDSRDRPGGGQTLFRALAFDSEFGQSTTTDLERSVGHAFDAAPVVIASFDPLTLAAPELVDFDRDGDLDVLVSAGADSRVVIQTGPGEWQEPKALGIPLQPGHAPSLRFIDLDRDGFRDVLSLRSDRALDVFWGVGVWEFEEPVRLELPGEPIASPAFEDGDIVPFDYDGDGDLDLIVVDLTAAAYPDGGTREERPFLFVQSAPRTFEAAEPVVPEQAVEDIFSAVVEDLDGDGRTDLILAVEGEDAELFGPPDTGGVFVYYRNELGEFDVDNVQRIGLGDEIGSVRDVAVADMDDDGDLDVVCGMGRGNTGFTGTFLPTLSGKLAIFYQDSARVFPESPMALDVPGPALLGGGVIGVAVADVDGNGALDLITQNLEGLVVIPARSPGVFGSPIRSAHALHNDTVTDSSPALVPGDVDGDGDLDLCYRNLLTGDIVILYQRGRGLQSFTDEPRVFSSTEPGISTAGANDAVVSDLNDDGLLDFAICTGGILGFGTENDVKIYTQIAPRNFNSIPIVPFAANTLTLPAQLDAADMDGDGDRDLLITDNGQNRLHVYRQQSPGAFEPFAVLEGPATANAPNAFWNSMGFFEVVDHDSDGDLDVLCLPSRHTELNAFRQVTPGQFELQMMLDAAVGDPKEFPPTGIPGTEPYGLQVADLDGDGELEIAMSLLGTSETLIFEESGPFVLDPEPALASSGAIGGSLVAADLDRDGDLDLVGFSKDPAIPILRVSLRQDDGTYSTSSILEGLYDPAGLVVHVEVVAPVDADADGDLDLAVVLGGSPLASIGRVAIVEQFAPGEFASRPRLVSTQTPAASALSVEDLDGDGELDLVLPTFGFGTGSVTVLWGND